MKEENYDLIIISAKKFSKILKRLSEHKNKTGIKTKIIHLNDIVNNTYFTITGRDLAEKIKYFIKNAKEIWKIKYVMLVGDIDIIPIRSVKIYDGNFITDLFQFLVKWSRK